MQPAFERIGLDQPDRGLGHPAGDLPLPGVLHQNQDRVAGSDQPGFIDQIEVQLGRAARRQNQAPLLRDGGQLLGQNSLTRPLTASGRG